MLRILLLVATFSLLMWTALSPAGGWGVDGRHILLLVLIGAVLLETYLTETDRW